jgi:ABC-type Fe3+ transport system substrate-binding protein
MMLPRSEAREAVQALVDFVEGKEVKRFINLAESKSLPGTPFVNKTNVDQFKAEY